MSAYIYFFFFNDAATTEIYTLSLHDALPISSDVARSGAATRTRINSAPSTLRISTPPRLWRPGGEGCYARASARSEEHTSELQSQSNLVCRLLLEKKNNNLQIIYSFHMNQIP